MTGSDPTVFAYLCPKNTEVLALKNKHMILGEKLWIVLYLIYTKMKHFISKNEIRLGLLLLRKYSQREHNIRE